MATTDDAPTQTETQTYADYLLVRGHRDWTHIPGRHPLVMDGFSWTAIVDRERVRAQRGEEAAAVADHTILGRGHIESVDTEIGGGYAVHVSPP